MLIKVSEYTQLKIKSIKDNNCYLDVCYKAEGKKKTQVTICEREVFQDVTGNYIKYDGNKYYIN